MIGKAMNTLNANTSQEKQIIRKQPSTKKTSFSLALLLSRISATTHSPIQSPSLPKRPLGLWLGPPQDQDTQRGEEVPDPRHDAIVVHQRHKVSRQEEDHREHTYGIAHTDHIKAETRQRSDQSRDDL